MAKIFTHVPHPHIAHRSAKGPPKVEDQFSTEGPIARFNTFLALKITAGVGTMWCAYAFAALAAVSLPSALRSHDAVTIVSWISQTFLQLVLLSIIIVGQNVQSGAADARAQATYEDADAVLHTALEIQTAHGGSGPTDQSDLGGGASPSIVSPIGRAVHPITARQISDRRHPRWSFASLASISTLCLALGSVPEGRAKGGSIPTLRFRFQRGGRECWTGTHGHRPRGSADPFL